MQQYQTILESQLKQGSHVYIGWPWRIFLLSLVLCILAALLYVGMRFGYEPYLNNQITGVTEETVVVEQEIQQAVQGDLVNFYSQLANLQTILDSLTLLSPHFSLLERNTHRSVYFDSLDIKGNDIKLSGFASTQDALSQQFEKLRTLPEFRNFIVTSALFNTTTKMYEFEITITLPQSQS